MQGKIALEEHFAIAATLKDLQVFGSNVSNCYGPGFSMCRTSA